MRVPSDIRDMLLAKFRGEITTRQQEELDSWLNATPENMRSAQELANRWLSFRRAVKLDHVSDTGDWDILAERIKNSRRAGILRRSFLAAACCIAAGCFLLLNILPASDKITVISPGVSANLILSSGEKFSLDEYVTFSADSETVAVKTEDLTTFEAAVTEGTALDCLLEVPAGCDYRFNLPDGSIVVMNAGSSIRFPGRFPGNERKVILDGEAFFEVTKDTERPFIICTDMVEVTVLGTSFNLSEYDTNGNTVLTLVEGSVKVTGSGGESVLAPGQQYTLDHLTGESLIKNVDTDIYTSWITGLFRFEAMPLEQLMKNLQRCFGVEYEFADDVQNVRFTGGFHKQDDFLTILDMLTGANNVTFRIKDNRIIIGK